MPVHGPRFRHTVLTFIFFRVCLQIFDFTLDNKDVATLDSLDKGIDGQLFDMKNIGGWVW